MKTTPALSLADIEAARSRLATGLRVTTCTISPLLSELVGMRITLKREDQQTTGSFKERGARNALLSLSSSERARGVVAASAGNHALGLAHHGRQLGIPVTVVVPVTAPAVKVDRCRALGARVVVKGVNFDEANAHATQLSAETGASFVHPFDDLRVIAGQGTVALEFLEQAPDIDTVVIPVGGGGLLAGAAIVVKALRPDIRVIAAEPEHAAKFLAAQLCGQPTRALLAPTLADGLAAACIGSHTFSIAASLVDDIVTVSEEEIAAAVAELAIQERAVVEGAGATALAAVLAGKVDGRSVLVPTSGRNIDPHVHEKVLACHAHLQRRAACAV